MLMRPFSTRFLTAMAFVLALALASGCSASRETAVVAERPAPPPAPEAPAPTPVQPALPALPGIDTVRAGRFDQGKMWTFDNPPLDYFEEAYGFRPDTSWFRRARLGALRFSTYCSASFVSPSGLVLTNHHCARESVTAVTRPGESLLENGFYATSLAEERKVPDLYVDQLVAIDDVTERVGRGEDERASDEARAQARAQRLEALERELTDAAKRRDTTLTVQVIALYNGGKYSAYTFKRYRDVRLVVAPELQLGYYGGDYDNFTYPRYALDMSFFRVYGPGGEPYRPEAYFPFNPDGAREGEAVFVVGSPGSTSRLATVAQLLFERDEALPQQLDFLRRRAALLKAYLDAHPDDPRAEEIRNDYFSIENSIKSMTGQLAGLRDPYLIARRAVAEQALRSAIQGADSLRRPYGSVLQDLAELQRSKQAIARQTGAFTGFGAAGGYSSHVVTRGLYGYIYAILKQRGAPDDQLAEIRKDALAVDDFPAPLEVDLITARLEELREGLGADDPTVRRLLGERTPREVAADVVARTALVDSARYAGLLESGYLSSGDASLVLVEALAPLYFSLAQQQQSLGAREENLEARLARARFAVTGTQNPPDASFSLRLADGVVRGYTYNGTRAPAFTTFFGLYNHYYSYGPDSDWKLPARWLNPPATFDRKTPLNLVSTNDITGGNSGSPLLDKDLRVVGLIFDSNVEALPNEYLYLDAVGRAVSVDARGILEALDDIYDADRIVQELKTGRLFETEQAADAQAGER